MADEMVTIKGVQDGLLITLSPTEEWLIITRELAERIDEQASFFAGAEITIDLGERPVPKHELSGLKALIERRNLSLNVIVSDSATTIEAANALDLRTNSNSTSEEVQEALPINPEVEGTDGVLIRHTMRSGRTIHSHGHIVILGDVNPGAEIVADGDIIIWGKLRGNVHAGANGDEDAIVCALDMTPTQLRIAGYITTSPPGKRRNPKPEIAYIRDDQIIVEAWNR